MFLLPAGNSSARNSFAGVGAPLDGQCECKPCYVSRCPVAAPVYFTASTLNTHVAGLAQGEATAA